MNLRLRSVTFNHDPAAVRGSAINVRLDGDQFALLPEWQGHNRPSFPAAYAIDENVNAELALVAEFTGQANSTAEVRALDIGSSPWPGFAGHVLGPVISTMVRLGPRGRSGPIRLPLPASRIGETGVSRYEITWLWQWRRNAAEPWEPCDQTTHVIYTLLQTPQAPWVQAPFDPANTQLPWVSVLEWACRWAAYTRTADRAAVAITRALYAMGGRTFAYDCSFGAPTNYAAPAFDCTAFLERLAGGLGRGPHVNCTDCATAVSTFANILGADLWQSQMFNPLSPLACNPVRLIGHRFFGPVCGTGFFNYHEVAWDGACTEIDQVYDASLEVAVPASPAYFQFPYVAGDIAFGEPDLSCYRDLLIAPLARSICAAQPNTRRRRPIY